MNGSFFVRAFVFYGGTVAPACRQRQVALFYGNSLLIAALHVKNSLQLFIARIHNIKTM
jgi:hypothetical protein